MHRLIIEYQNQLKMLNLRNQKTYTISGDKSADITLDNFNDVIHLEQNEQGTWQANHSSIFKGQERKTNDGNVSLYLFDTSNIASFVYPNTREVITIGP